MHYKTNRLNHDFQIAYFIAGSCQTPDAAYSILCDLREDRSNALKSFEAYNLRDQAKIKRAELKILSGDEADRLEGQADIVELKALAETTQKNYDAALDEVAFIEACMEKLQPLRKFAHLPDAQAHEAAQHQEWKLQLIHTAENHMLSGHAIPADHFSTMRMHPAFATEILPAIDKLSNVLTEARTTNNGGLIAAYLKKQKEESEFNLPKLLGAPDQEAKPELLGAATGEQAKPTYPNYGPRA
jgi:hypothetical protein